MKQMIYLLAVMCIIGGCRSIKSSKKKSCSKYKNGLFKHDDIQRARKNVEKHDWAKALLQGYRRSSTFWLNCPNDKLDFWIPDIDGRWKVYCPECGGEPDAAWKLSKNGEQIICRQCDLKWPHKDYQENHSYTIQDPTGKSRTINYYKGKTQFIHKENIGDKYHLSGKMAMLRLMKLKYLDRPAKVYALTGELKYAEKVKRALLRFAEVYPHFLSKFRATSYKQFTENNMAGKLCGWKYFDSVLIVRLAVAYELTRDSGLYSENEQHKIEQGIFTAYKEMITAQSPMSDHCRNAIPFHYAAAAVSGIILKDHDLIAWAVEGPDGYKAFLKKFFHRDGHWYEDAPSYENMALEYLYVVPEALRGYSDPVSYNKPDRYDNLNLFEEPILKKILIAGMYTTMPDGFQLAVNDSTFGRKYPWYRAEMNYFWYPTNTNKELLTDVMPINTKGNDYSLFRRDPDLELRSNSQLAEFKQSTVRPGPHYAILRTGDKTDEAAAVVNYGSIHCGHIHNSILNLTYYDFGREMVTDLGYLAWAHPNRPWLESTLSHNLVIVDGKRQQKKTQPKLELFSGQGNVQALIVSDNQAYAPSASTYRRYVIMINHNKGQRYLVDLFSITGGENHQYVMHADGETFIPPEKQFQKIDPLTLGDKNAGYDWLNDCKAAKINNVIECQWLAEPKTSLGTRMFMMPKEGTEFIYAKAPGLRNRKTPLAKKDLYPVIIKRNGPENQFVNIIECFKGKPGIIDVKPLKTTVVAGWAQAVEVKYQSRQDIIVIANKEAAKNDIILPDYPEFKFKGHLAVISLKNNKLDALWMQGGELLNWQDKTLTGIPEIYGKIVTVNNKQSSITVDQATHISENMKLDYLFVNKHHDGIYPIQSIKTENGSSTINMPHGEILNFKKGDSFYLKPVYTYSSKGN